MVLKTRTQDDWYDISEDGVIGVIHLRDEQSVRLETGVFVLYGQFNMSGKVPLNVLDVGVYEQKRDQVLSSINKSVSDFGVGNTFVMDIAVPAEVIERYRAL